MKKQLLIIAIIILTVLGILYFKVVKLNSKTIMSKSKPSISKSLTNHGSLIVNDTSKFRKRTEVLYHKDGTMLRGINNIPYALATTPDFDPDQLPEEFRRKILQLQFISFNRGFGTDKVINGNTYRLQSWISKQKNLRYIELSFFKLNDLIFIKKLPIEYLVLKNVSISNKEQVVKDIKSMKHITYIVQDNLFNIDDINNLKSYNVNFNVMSFKEYITMNKEKKIDLDDISMIKYNRL